MADIQHFTAEMALLATTASIMEVSLTDIKNRVFVDMDSRQVTVKGKFGNDHDHLAKKTVLEITRYVDDVDLADHTCAIHWGNGKNGGIMPVTKRDLSEDGKILVLWELTGEFTEYSGDIVFAVHFFSVVDGNFTFHSSSDAGQGKLGATFNASDHGQNNITPSEIEKYIAIMNEFSLAIDEQVKQVTEMKEAIDAAEEDVIGAIEQKGAEVLASIPQDYTALSEKVSQHSGEIDDFDNGLKSFDMGAFEYGWIDASGVESVSNTQMRSTAFLRFAIGEKYNVHMKNGNGAVFRCYDENYTFIESKGVNATETTAEKEIVFNYPYVKICLISFDYNKYLVKPYNIKITKQSTIDKRIKENSKHNSYISVFSFGAIGDGENDDTKAIATALNSGGAIFFPKGIYKITNSILINKSVIIKGCGKESVLLYKGIDTKDHIFQICENTNNAGFVSIDDICIDGNFLAKGILDGLQDSTITTRLSVDNVLFRNCKTALNCYAMGSRFTNILIYGSSTQFEITKTGINVAGTDNMFSNIRIMLCSDYGIYCDASSNRFNNVKCCVCGIGAFFGSSNCYASIELQENYKDNLYLNGANGGTFYIHTNGAGCRDLPDDDTSNTNYALLRIESCNGVSIKGSAISQMTFSDRKSHEGYVLLMSGANINNSIDISYIVSDTEAPRTKMLSTGSTLFNTVKINNREIEPYNTIDATDTIYLSAASRTTIESTLENNKYDISITINDKLGGVSTPVFSFPHTNNFISIGFDIKNIDINNGYIALQYTANGIQHTVSFDTKYRKISYNDKFNTMLYTVNIGTVLANDETYQDYITDGIAITNKRIIVALNLDNVDVGEVVEISNFTMCKAI